jgi:hypothetical protein
MEQGEEACGARSLDLDVHVDPEALFVDGLY